jgi:hypothetical protein
MNQKNPSLLFETLRVGVGVASRREACALRLRVMPPARYALAIAPRSGAAVAPYGKPHFVRLHGGNPLSKSRCFTKIQNSKSKIGKVNCYLLLGC